MKKNLALFLLIASFFLFAGLAEAGVRRNWWPLFFYQESSDKSARELELFGPLIYSYRTPKESATAFRPFWAEVKGPDQYDFYFLSPLGHYQQGKDYSRLRFIPFISVDDNHSKKKHFRSFLLYFWGESPQGQKYWGFFPFYGTLYDFFGKDEIKFYMWPVYIRSRIDENISRTYFWPFYNRTDGPTLYQRKFWPIYGVRIKKDFYERKFFLWPFFGYLKWREGEDSFAERKMFFPFWIQEKSPNFRRYTLLWPLFRYYRNEKTDTTRLDLPRPFFTFGEGKNPPYHERKFWPLLGHRKIEDSDYHFFLWPFFLFYRDILCLCPKKIYQNESRVLLFSRFTRIKDENGKIYYEFGRLWPLAEHMRREDGSKVFFIPAIIPFHHEGIDRTIAPLLKLYEYIRFPDGTTRSKALWGFYRHDCTKDKKILELAFLLSYETRKDGFNFQLLNGLFGFGKRHNDWHLKLLFLSIF